MMDPARFAEVDRILRAVLDVPPAERDAAVDRACGGDEELLREVRSLLGHESPSEAFLDGAVGAVGIPEAEPPPGWRAGPWRIKSLLGSGGMGSVWLAERDDAEYRKQVAVKVIKRGMDTEEILGRFRRERQVQAGLEHPNIVRVLDAGATDDGRPYLVMEYVEGKQILAHCSEAGLPIADRLRLFQKICGAVQYAHQNLVVHRDLKPGNILVTSDGEPKLLDFGIAKVLQPAGGDVSEAELTGTSLRPMTPRYASPEQVRGEPATTATDVYSLGVILCELLAGHGPYDVPSESLSDYERAIGEREPLPPSDAAVRSGMARARHQLRGDVDAIVLKALRKDPRLRYPSAEQLSEDIGRHLSGFPVLARRGTARYRAARFLRRNAFAAGAVAAVFLTLVGGILATLQQARVAERERKAALAASTRAEEAADLARRAARRSQRIAHFLQDVLEGASPRRDGRGLTAEEALDRAATNVYAQFGDDPGVEAAVHAVVGETYRALGRYPDAERQLEEALGILESAGGGEPGDLASCLIELGAVAYARRDWEKARLVTERALSVAEQALGPGHAEVARCLNNLGAIARAEGRLERAEELLGKALEIRRRVFGAEHETVAETLNNLQGVLVARRDFEAAERVSREVLAMRQRIFGDTHPDTIQSLDNLAVILAERGDLESAEALTRQAVARYEERVGPYHPDLAVALRNRGRVLASLRRHAEAEDCLRRALEIRRSALTPEDDRTIATARLLAASQIALGRHEEAETTLGQAREDAEAALGSRHPSVLALIGDLASLYEAWGKPDRAKELHALLGVESRPGREGVTTR